MFVTDESGGSVPGVTILLKGTGVGAITGGDGSYTLETSQESGVLVFSFVGMETVEKIFEGNSTINVTMKVASIGLEEVVAVGYGSVSKRDLTGAVVSVGNEDLVAIGASSPMAAMQGQIAGVNISARTGLVGSEYDIQIRGVNSLTGGSPLYVVDGVMTDNINFLNPTDIERIDILKDASSTAIYGSRGSNGVVLVTTRSGEGAKGKAVFSYSGSVGIRTLANIPDFVDYDEGVLYTMNRSITRSLYRGEAISSPDNLFGFPSEGTSHDYWKEALDAHRENRLD